MSFTSRCILPYLLALTGPTALAESLLPADLSEVSPGLEAFLQLPGSDVRMLQLDGRIYFLSGHGRYAFAGEAWDLWHGQRLESVEQAKELASRVDLDRLKLDPADLGAIPFGTQQPDTHPLWVFVDPLSSACQELLHRLADAEMPAQVIPLSAGGDESAQAARRLLCSPSPEAARSALLDRSWSDLPAPSADCDTQPLIRALITAKLLGIHSVPALIAPDGRIQQGVPANLTAWLGGGQP